MPLSSKLDKNTTGAPGLTETFVGSGEPTNMAQNVHLTAASADAPEIGAQFSIASNMGKSDATTAYKIALTASVIGGADSASVYGLNTIVGGHAGSGGILVTGVENDIQNYGADATTLGSSSSTYGTVNVGSGSYLNTAAYWLTSSHEVSDWAYGYAASPGGGLGVRTATFYDSGTSAASLLKSVGTHTDGVDLSGATISGSAFKSANFNVSNVGAVTTNGQLVFPAVQNPSTNPNILDDYKEFSFTPTLVFGTTAPTGLTYSTQVGRGVKIGRQVTLTARLALSSRGTGGAGIALIGSSPFTPAHDGAGNVGVSIGVSLGSGYVPTIITLGGNGYLFLSKQSATSGTQVNWSEVADNYEIIFTVTFFV